MAGDEIGSELDRMSIQILEFLNEFEGDATSSDLRKALGHDDTMRVNYRRDEYLLPGGYIETERRTSPSGESLPMRWEITERGRDALEEIEKRDREMPLAVRVDSLEDQLTGLRNEMQELQSVVENREQPSDDSGRRSEDETDDAPQDGGDGGQGNAAGDGDVNLTRIESQLNTLMDDLSGLHQRVVALEEDRLFSREYRQRLNTLQVMASTSKEFFQREYGDEMFQEVFDMKREEYTDGKFPVLDIERHSNSEER